MSIDSNILLAESAGFCMGVSLALSKLDKALEKKEQLEIFTFGPIIHNPQVLSHYEHKGVKITENWNEPSAGDIVLIRAHGVPVEVEKHLSQKDIRTIDATCPKVKKAQVLINKNSKNTDCLLLYGEPDHPEVKGLMSYANSKTYLFESFAELKTLSLEKNKHYCLAAQTTQDREQFKEIAKYLKNELDQELVVLDTICDATKNRQVETIEIARKVQCMIVVGGKTSGNTRRLHKVAKEHCPTCIHIETEQDLDPSMLTTYTSFGLTAGASTPDDTINKVYHELKDMINSR
ncbi:MAG: 4-hydroxy-3-methylbut-2-enyl diphosphate reductase [Desulfonatronovibrio sp. MSAO_Bac4]|nr:MAG: 4-hydroxy-3-methylbut-2-enyl diphosphate reductase [Desulfonatronovibrio sp. MSAO_Bac4]